MKRTLLLLLPLLLLTGCTSKEEKEQQEAIAHECNQKIFCADGTSFFAQKWNAELNVCQNITFPQGNPCEKK